MTSSVKISIKKLFVTVAVGLCLFASAALGQGKLSVRIPAEVSVETDQIAINDIAAVSGGDANTLERVKHISLGFSPRVGMTREIQRANIMLALAAAGFGESDILLDVPVKVSVKRAAQSVSQDLLRKTVEKAVLSQFENENVTAKITRITLPESLDLPTGNVEIKVVNFSGITNFLVPATLSLELRVDGKVLRRIPVTVEVEASADVLVLNHAGKSGARVTGADVRMENIRLEQALKNYLRAPSDLAGKKLLKDLPEASPLTTDTVAADAVIKSGDTVSIIAQSGNMKIAITGEARASGRIGDHIAVKNNQSGVILQALVIAEGVVKLNY
jgi:flagella basal body P-ring formation protein FlgA